MLTFKRKNENEFALYDDAVEKAWVEVEQNIIKKITYQDEKIERAYGEFVVRSAVYVLSNHYREIKSAFYDVRLKNLGFNETESGMVVDILKLNFDNCCCKKQEE